MKKLTVNLIIIILMIVSVQPVFAEDTEIEGLHENWSRLFMTNCFTEEEIAAMDEEYMTAWKEKLLNEIIPSRVALGRLETDTAETEYEYELEQAKLDYSNGLRVSILSTNRYAEQYTENGTFEYLYSNIEYWSVPGIYNYPDKVKFTIDGTYINNTIEYFGDNYNGFILQNEGFNWIKNKQNIQNIAEEKNIQLISSIKLFTLIHNNTFLYLNSDKD